MWAHSCQMGARYLSSLTQAQFPHLHTNAHDNANNPVKGVKLGPYRGHVQSHMCPPKAISVLVGFCACEPALWNYGAHSCVHMYSSPQPRAAPHVGQEEWNQIWISPSALGSSWDRAEPQASLVRGFCDERSSPADDLGSRCSPLGLGTLGMLFASSASIPNPWNEYNNP